MKRLVLILLCLVLAAGLFTAAALADDTPDIDDYTFLMHIYDNNGQLVPEEQTHSMRNMPTFAGYGHSIKIYYKGQEITSGIVSETPDTLSIDYDAQTGIWELRFIGDPGEQIGISFPVPDSDTRVLHPYWLQDASDTPEEESSIVYRYAKRHDGMVYEDETEDYSNFSWMGPFVGNSMQAYFYYHDGTSYLPVTDISLSGSAARICFPRFFICFLLCHLLLFQKMTPYDIILTNHLFCQLHMKKFTELPRFTTIS